MADWATISALATAGGTLVLAGATFASVRSANRAARAAERSLLASLRPLLMQSRLDDPPQKVGFADSHWMVAQGGGGAADVTDEAVYLAIALRNAGSGIAVLHGWYLYPQIDASRNVHAPLDEFVRLTRDLYIAAGDVGFWQGTFRDPSSPEYAAARAAIEAREPMMVEVLYSDHEGGQRVITRFLMAPRSDGDGYIAGAGRHWQIDRDDPR
jgi:hypothetical protein